VVLVHEQEPQKWRLHHKNKICPVNKMMHRSGHVAQHPCADMCSSGRNVLGDVHAAGIEPEARTGERTRKPGRDALARTPGGGSNQEPRVENQRLSENREKSSHANSKSWLRKRSCEWEEDDRALWLCARTNKSFGGSNNPNAVEIQVRTPKGNQGHALGSEQCG
jgi:hypothetical protein